MLANEAVVVGWMCAMVGAAVVAQAGDEAAWLSPSDPRVAVMGRVDRSDPARLRVGYPGVTFRLQLSGARLSARLASSSGNTHIGVIVDGAPPRIVKVTQGQNDYVLADGLETGPHLVDVVHRTETWQGVLTVLGFQVSPGGELMDPPPWPSRRLLVIGDSVTCGEGVDRGSDCTKSIAMSNGYGSYGMLAARHLDAQCHLVCFGGRGLIRDWRGDTDVLTGPELFDLALPDEGEGPPAPRWDHTTYTPDAVVVSLGTNDFNLSIGPLPTREAFVPAYVELVRTIRRRYPKAHVFLTEGAIVNDGDPDGPRPRTVLRDYIDATIAELVDPLVHHAAASHFPGDECDAHPTGEQHRRMAQELEAQLRAALGW